MVKTGHILSEWLSISKWASQGSIMGPFACNIFTNDLLQLERHGNVVNYAKDNTEMSRVLYRVVYTKLYTGKCS